MIDPRLCNKAALDLFLNDISVFINYYLEKYHLFGFEELWAPYSDFSGDYNARCYVFS